MPQRILTIAVVLLGLVPLGLAVVAGAAPCRPPGHALATAAAPGTVTAVAIFGVDLLASGADHLHGAFGRRTGGPVARARA